LSTLDQRTAAIHPGTAGADVVALNAPAVALRPDLALRRQLAAIGELTKPRITRLVTITSAVGFVMAAVRNQQWLGFDLVLSAVGCLTGTALSAAGASALNQWWERARDAQMPRTASRPLPQGRTTPAAAVWSGIALCAAGVLVLYLLCGVAPALVSLATILLYVLVYTPLKPITTIATIIGAVPGALPPLIGWTAGSSAAKASVLGPLGESGGWSLFLLMFVWQIPHFLAIAWMYKDDYAKGGFKMLPLIDPTGRRTAATVLLWAAALLPATIAPALAMSDNLSWFYPVVAGATGVAYLVAAFKFNGTISRDNARRVFFASIIHLPLLLVAMVSDALVTRLL
jgi:heme o synthase